MISFIPPTNPGQEPRRLSSEGGPSVGGPVIGAMEHCSTANGAQGELEELLRNHTLFLYYASTCCAETRMMLARRLMNGSSPRLRLPRLPAPIELERTEHLYCPICREEQLAVSGRSGQMTYHVLPLEKVCPLHDALLVDETRKQGPALEMASVDRIVAARRFAHMSAKLLSLTFPEAIDAFRAELKARLAAAGFYRSDGNLRGSALDDAMCSYYKRSAFDVRLRQLAADEHRASRTAHALFGEMRSQHPVLVILLAMLLEDPEFPEQFGLRSGADPQFARRPAPNAPTVASNPNAHRRWTEYGGRITRLLKMGYSPKRVAAMLAIPIDRVYHLVRRDGLWELVDGQSLARERDKRRNAWAEALKRCPGRTTNFVRNKEPRVYRWLYEHDRAWLLQHGTGVHTWECVQRSNRRRPYGADAKLASRIVEIGKTTRERLPAIRCSRRHLVVETGLTQSSFEDALRWKRVADAVAQAEESVSAFHARVHVSSNENL